MLATVGAGRDVVFATPTRLRPTDAYLAALEASIPALDAAGWRHRCVFERGTTYISWARAVLLRRVFVEANADICVFLDDDVSWTPAALTRLLDTPGDVVAGLYRMKLDHERYMGVLVDAPDRRPIVRDDGAIAGHFVPAGFLKITRRIWERMNEAYPELRFGSAGNLDAFKHGADPEDHVWFGEDYAFSKRVRAMGDSIWIVPDLDLTHNCRDSGRTYPGNFHRFLLKQPGGSEYRPSAALVSIVIPCFNYARFVSDAIDSALAQTHDNVEVIVVDDGSTDNTWDVVKEYANRGVNCIWQANAGVGAARNAGIAVARGEWVICLDADDKLHPEYIERCLMRDADIISTSVHEFGRNGDRYMSPPPAPVLADFLRENRIHCASMFRRKVWESIGGWNESRAFDAYEDWEFWLRALKAGFTVQTVDEPLFYYRKHGPSMVDVSLTRHDELATQVRAAAGV